LDSGSILTPRYREWTFTWQAERQREQMQIVTGEQTAGSPSVTWEFALKKGAVAKADKSPSSSLGKMRTF